jgi:hypothetical protein
MGGKHFICILVFVSPPLALSDNYFLKVLTIFIMGFLNGRADLKYDHLCYTKFTALVNLMGLKNWHQYKRRYIQVQPLLKQFLFPLLRDFRKLPGGLNASTPFFFKGMDDLQHLYFATKTFAL